jgi:hypothetical protein
VPARCEAPVLIRGSHVRFRLWIQPVDATLLLLAQSLVCCIDWLNPQPKANITIGKDKRILRCEIGAIVVALVIASGCSAIAAKAALSGLPG